MKFKAWCADHERPLLVDEAGPDCIPPGGTIFDDPNPNGIWEVDLSAMYCPECTQAFSDYDEANVDDLDAPELPDPDWRIDLVEED